MVNPLHKQDDKCDYISSDVIDIEDFEKANIIGCYLTKDNELTGETRKIKSNDIISWPCQGGCGYSTADCRLIMHNCQYWYCPNGQTMRNIACTGLFIYKKRTRPDPCSGCGGHMSLYLSDEDKKTVDIISSYIKK